MLYENCDLILYSTWPYMCCATCLLYSTDFILVICLEFTIKVVTYIQYVLLVCATSCDFMCYVLQCLPYKFWCYVRFVPQSLRYKFWLHTRKQFVPQASQAYCNETRSLTYVNDNDKFNMNTLKHDVSVM